MIFPLSLVPRPWFGLTEDFHNIQNIQTCKIILILKKNGLSLPCTVCNCASTANRWWQRITTPIFAIDGVAVFSLPLRWLCSPLQTSVLPHFSCCLHPHFDFNWKWLFIAWFGGYCNGPICHAALLSHCTQWLCHAPAFMTESQIVNYLRSGHFDFTCKLFTGSKTKHIQYHSAIMD